MQFCHRTILLAALRSLPDNEMTYLGNIDATLLAGYHRTKSDSQKHSNRTFDIEFVHGTNCTHKRKTRMEENRTFLFRTLDGKYVN